MSDLYLWIKTFHILAVISWMAGLLYLPRLFVYHVERGQEHEHSREMLEVMEYRLLRYIMNPAMMVSWLAGLALLATPGVVSFSDVWIWVKLVSVLAMTGFHMWLSARRKALLAGNDTMSGRGYRFANEVPTLLMIVIVGMVILRPF